MKKPNILITNDDGIHAPGIRHLWKALKDKANVTVVAPAAEQSAVGLSITIRHPLQIHKMEWGEAENIWCVTGTPADCVKMALSVILKEKPDMVVSGINRGTNAGRNVLYSGTVGGVIEAVMHEIPGIAFSCREYRAPKYEAVEHLISPVVDHLIEHRLPSGTFLNVNFPENCKGGIRGFKFARQGKEFWGENPDERYHPAEGHAYYWMGAKLLRFDEHEESDIAWLMKGYATAVPVHVGELTDMEQYQKRKAAFEKIFVKPLS